MTKSKSFAFSAAGLKFLFNSDKYITLEDEIEIFRIPTDMGDWDVSVNIRHDGEVPIGQVLTEARENNVLIRYHAGSAPLLENVRSCLLHMPMEEIFLEHDRFILHSSFVTSKFGGLLFTGNSGIGKSTQSSLWEKYRGSTIVNGDRTVISKEGSKMYAYGSFYTGSSHYCMQRKEPVGAVIFLEQSEDNIVTEAGEGEGFRHLLLQISSDCKNEKDENRLCDLIAYLEHTVPLLKLSCTPDERAVTALEKWLGKP
ncbi:MAG: hypothetical protein LUH40_04245 [Clostridiales bacterium]|nr:hypothetical protein [Clostridiales bacterium]